MTKLKEDPTGAGKLLLDGHSETLQKTDELQEILRNLRYEGKPFFGKNLKAAREVLAFFNGELAHHVKLEEEVVFPFLKAHLPKLEPMTWLLQAEHRDFRINLECFRSLLARLSRERKDLGRGPVIDEVRETGTYLIYLLRSHIRTEKGGLYNVMDKELRPDEKSELRRKIVRSEECCKRHERGEGGA